MSNSDQHRSALYLGVGAVSPLWPAFAAVASASAAYWWFSRLTLGQWRPELFNLEAVLEAPVVVDEPVVTAVVAAIAPALASEKIETVDETLAEPVLAPVQAVDEAMETAAHEMVPIVEAAAPKSPLKKTRTAAAKPATLADTPVPLKATPAAMVTTVKAAVPKRAPVKAAAVEAAKVDEAKPAATVDAADQAKTSTKTKVRTKAGAPKSGTRPQRTSQLRRLRQSRRADD